MSKLTFPIKNVMKENEPKLFERLQELIQKNQKFIITTHVVPDGDGLGGEIALATYLKNLGKECRIINSDPTPDKFSLVDPDCEIEVWSKKTKLTGSDIIFGVYVNEQERIGKLPIHFRKLNVPIIFIDHHILEDPFCEQHIIDESISSMGEFFYRFFKYVKAEISFKMALAMYVSLITDTRHFRHRKTTSLSHAIAAALVEIGVNPATVHQNIHQRRSIPEIHLLGEALKRIRSVANGKIVWIEISRALQKKYNATVEDTQGFIDHLMVLKDAQVGLVFREEGNGRVKVSFRSRENIPIYPLAKQLGGGGHAYEAGTVQKGSLKSVVEKVLTQVKKLI